MPTLNVGHFATVPAAYQSVTTASSPALMNQPHMRELMQLSPGITGGAIVAVVDSFKLAHFYSWERRKGLRNVTAAEDVAPGALTTSVDALRRVLQLAATAPAVMTFRCHRVVHAALVCQRFIRRVLRRLRQTKALAFLHWDAVQTRARRTLDAFVRETCRRRQKEGSGLHEELWGLLLDCYASPEEMQEAIDLHTREVHWCYARELRQYRKVCARAAHHAAAEAYRRSRPSLLSTTGSSDPRARRPLSAEPMAHAGWQAAPPAEGSSGPPLSPHPTPPPAIATLCAWLAYVREVRAQESLTRAPRRPAFQQLTLPVAVRKPDVTPAGAVATGQPVSYYHALLTCDPRVELPFLLALRLTSTAATRSLADGWEAGALGAGRFWAPPPHTLARARALALQWREQLGRTTAGPAPASEEAAGRTGSPSRPSSAGRIGNTGSPLARVCTGARRQLGLRQHAHSIDGLTPSSRSPSRSPPLDGQPFEVNTPLQHMMLPAAARRPATASARLAMPERRQAQRASMSATLRLPSTSGSQHAQRQGRLHSAVAGSSHLPGAA